MKKNMIKALLVLLVVLGLAACNSTVPTEVEQGVEGSPSEGLEYGDSDFDGVPQWVLDELPEQALENLRAAIRIGEPFTMQVDSERRFVFPDDMEDNQDSPRESNNAPANAPAIGSEQSSSENLEYDESIFDRVPQWVFDELPEDMHEPLRESIRLGEPFVVQVDSERRFTFPDDLE